MASQQNLMSINKPKSALKLHFNVLIFKFIILS